MPIRPDLRHFYQGSTWRETRARILARAGNRCEACKKRLGRDVYTYTWQTWAVDGLERRREYHMIWVPLNGRVWRDQAGKVIQTKGWWPAAGLPRRIRVELGVAHVDHNPANMDDGNLRAWCNWCHLHHDNVHHKEARSAHKDSRRPLLEASV